MDQKHETFHGRNVGRPPGRVAFFGPRGKLPQPVADEAERLILAGVGAARVHEKLLLSSYGVRAGTTTKYAQRLRKEHGVAQQNRPHGVHHRRTKRRRRGEGGPITSPFDLPADILDKVYHVLDRAMAGPAEIYRMFGLAGYGIGVRGFERFCHERRERLGLPFGDTMRPVSTRVAEATDIICRIIDGMGLARYAGLVVGELAERIVRPSVPAMDETATPRDGGGAP